MAGDPSAAIYEEVPGGAELVHWFGQVPTFHDAEVLSLDLRRRDESILRLHGWINTGKARSDGYFELDKHAVVSFTMKGIMDLELYGFSGQNVIGQLILRRAPDRQDRRPFLSLPPLPQDIELELEPCYGLNGLIRVRSVSIAFEPGKPAEQNA